MALKILDLISVQADEVIFFIKGIPDKTNSTITIDDSGWYD